MKDESLVRLPLLAPGSGTYRYRLNGNDTEMSETFEVSSNATTISSERRAPGGTVLVVAVEADDDLNARCHIAFRSDDVKPLLADYTLAAGRLTVQRSTTATDAESTGLQGVLSPLLRVFQGPAIAATIRAGGECTIVVPALDPSESEALLSPTFQARRAERLGVESDPAVPDRATPDTWPLRHCRYIGGNYDDAAEFWLDEEDRLVRYRFPQSPTQLWEVRLELS